MGEEKTSPIEARRIPANIERRIEVCIDFESLFSSLAPKCWATITPAPAENPRAKFIRHDDIIVVHPTAASAFGSDENLPTTILSAIL